MSEYYDAQPHEGPGRPFPILIGDQPLPHSLENERAVLGCMLQDPASAIDIGIESLETREAYYVPIHRTIHDCLEDIRSKVSKPEDIDLVTVADWLDTRGKLEQIGGMPFLRELKNCVPTTINMNRYMAAVKNFHNARKMIAECSDLVGKAFETGAEEIPELLSHAETKITEIGKNVQEDGFVHISHDIPQAIEMFNGTIQRDPVHCGTPTGFKAIDDIIIGLKPGEMSILAARPSIGKTALALNIAKRMTLFERIRVPVGIFSFEMGREQIVLREIYEDARIDMKKAYQGRINPAQLQEDMSDAANRLQDIPLFHYTGVKKISSVRRHTKKLVREQSVKVIIIDYLQLVQADNTRRNDNREQEVAKNSAAIKDLAQELNIHIMVLAQLGRAAEGRDGKISDLRESGSIEQDADVIAILNRLRESEDEETAKLVEAGKGIPSKLIIAKNRNGATGTAELTFFPAWTKFEDPERICDEDIPI
jgi:replicative DNA helicase